MSNDYILKLPQVGITARSLSRILGLRRYNEPQKHPPLIRWGNSMSGIFSNDTELNDKKHIAIAGNKIRTAKELETMGDKVISYHKLTRDSLPERYPIVVRTLLSASGGKGIVLLLDDKEISKYMGNWYSYYISFKSEYRFHVLEGQFVKGFKKLYDGEEEAEYPIRNLHNNYHFSLVNADSMSKAQDFCKAVYEKLPMSFMAIDAGFVNSEYYVIEVNSAPGLNNPTLVNYVRFINKKLNLHTNVDARLYAFFRKYTDYNESSITELLE